MNWLKNIQNLESSCKKSAKIATESIAKVETLKRENIELRKEVEELKKERVTLSSQQELTNMEQNDLQKKLDAEIVRSGRLAESIAFVKVI